MPTIALVVDDDEINRLVLEGMLTLAGYAVFFAENGQQALRVFADARPDVVLMDVMMPVMDGYEATRRIKALSEDRFVPVIFLTAMSHDSDLAKCIEAGGEDFLTKPFSQVVLLAKLASLTRTKSLIDLVKQQRDGLNALNAQLRREHVAAQQIFARLLDRGCLSEPEIQHLISPLSIFNGDLLLAARAPGGALNVLLADATGHGLSAAMSTLPVADVFYEMTSRGLPLASIARGINDKLRNVLPTGAFMCVAMVAVSADGRRAQVWNSGLPDVIAHGSAGLRRVASFNPPLAVVPSDSLDFEAPVLAVERNERFYLCSDGLTEAQDASGEMFGESRFAAALGQWSPGRSAFDTVLAALAAHQGEQAQSDDLSLVEVTVSEFAQK